MLEGLCYIPCTQFYGWQMLEDLCYILCTQFDKIDRCLMVCATSRLPRLIVDRCLRICDTSRVPSLMEFSVVVVLFVSEIFFKLKHVLFIFLSSISDNNCTQIMKLINYYTIYPSRNNKRVRYQRTVFLNYFHYFWRALLKWYSLRVSFSCSS